MKYRMPTPKLTKEIVDAAIFGFEEQKRRLDAQIADLRGLFPNGHGTARPNPPARKKGGMSAAGRKAIAEAQRKRRLDAQIADLRGLFPNGHGTARPNPPARKKGGMSAAGRKAIAEAQRK